MSAYSDIPPPPDEARQRPLGQRLREHRIDYLFLLPGLAIFGAFVVWPLFAANWFALLDWSGFDSRQVFVGLQNYRDLLGDEFFRAAFVRSILFTAITVPLQMLLGLVLAVVLNNRLLKLSALFRTMIFLPVVTPVAVIAIVMALMLSPFNGPINDLLQSTEIVQRAVDFLGSPQLVMWSLAGIYVWKWTGVTLIYWLAALQTVPDELYEACKLDGVRGWQVTRYVILPIIAPFAVVIGLISAISALNVFPLIQATTQGGPFFASEVMEVFIFRTAFAPPSGTFPQLGYASAAGVLFGLAVMGLTILQVLAVRHARRKEPTNG
ncbi:sugar ABC transporter, permease protein [Oceanicola granulosus HTCC2516]|uniref:Sugar ABC transporter, permease protein n=1 Tax=Oceanicola granulosus (strain ATCC BAA-861 / DSM 15982 / KCTC 12143 / HTCC2516) TaxID=314256 RepID=Q2CEI9_OCEGH|nr:sugar ABC transporter permease [Oceanicola granulosus]EAR51143.1 sugar ABC transporter, permease protein [Oceanicola granulosus HTCC2516]